MDAGRSAGPTLREIALPLQWVLEHVIAGRRPGQLETGIRLPGDTEVVALPYRAVGIALRVRLARQTVGRLRVGDGVRVLALAADSSIVILARLPLCFATAGWLNL